MKKEDGEIPHYTKNHLCPSCKLEMNALTPTNGSMNEPSEGHITICLNCGQISVFNSDMSLSPITMELLNEIEEKEPASYAHLLRAKNAILKIIAQKKKKEKM